MPRYREKKKIVLLRVAADAICARVDAPADVCKDVSLWRPCPPVIHRTHARTHARELSPHASRRTLIYTLVRSCTHALARSRTAMRNVARPRDPHARWNPGHAGPLRLRHSRSPRALLSLVSPSLLPYLPILSLDQTKNNSRPKEFGTHRSADSQRRTKVRSGRSRRRQRAEHDRETGPV